jgi:hypothetical protein
VGQGLSSNDRTFANLPGLLTSVSTSNPIWRLNHMGKPWRRTELPSLWDFPSGPFFWQLPHRALVERDSNLTTCLWSQQTSFKWNHQEVKWLPQCYIARRCPCLDRSSSLLTVFSAFCSVPHCLESRRGNAFLSLPAWLGFDTSLATWMNQSSLHRVPSWRLSKQNLSPSQLWPISEVWLPGFKS